MCAATRQDVRFGSQADICSAKRHVRFTPDSNIDCAFADLDAPVGAVKPWRAGRHFEKQDPTAPRPPRLLHFLQN